MGVICHRQMITMDDSLSGWGVVFKGRSACGVWSGKYLAWHINGLELRAVHLALTHFLLFLAHSHVIIRTDNMVVVSHIKRQGGSRSHTLNKHARQLLLWAQDKFLSLRAVHVPEVLNLAADFLSRHNLRSGEWMLNHQMVDQIWERFGAAEVKSSHLYLYSVFNNTDCVKALNSIKLEDRVSVMYNNKIKHSIFS